MDMWNWIYDCFRDQTISLEELENILIDDNAAEEMWKDFSEDSEDFIDYVREQVKHFIIHAKK